MGLPLRRRATGEVLMADITPTITTLSGRSYQFVPDKSGGTLFRINDTAQPWLAMLARGFPTELTKALASIGFWIRGELKNAVNQGGPAGQNWPELSRVQTYRTLDDLKGSNRNPATHPFSTLGRAIGYRQVTQSMYVAIGWLSKSAARYGAKLQAGFETPITPTMRRMFFAAGVGLVKTGSITTPARPLMSPVFQQIQDQIPGRIESKIADYLRRLGQNLRAA